MENIMEFMSSTSASLLALGWYVLCVVAMWKLFAKAGVPGWASLIPFYNLYCLYKISMGNGWWFLLTIIPLVGLFLFIFMNIKLAQAFGKSRLFALGLIVFNGIFMLILGLGSDHYYGSH